MINCEDLKKIQYTICTDDITIHFKTEKEYFNYIIRVDPLKYITIKHEIFMEGKKDEKRNT